MKLNSELKLLYSLTILPSSPHRNGDSMEQKFWQNLESK